MCLTGAVQASGQLIQQSLVGPDTVALAADTVAKIAAQRKMAVVTAAPAQLAATLQHPVMAGTLVLMLTPTTPQVRTCPPPSALPFCPPHCTCSHGPLLLMRTPNSRRRVFPCPKKAWPLLSLPSPLPPVSLLVLFTLTTPQQHRCMMRTMPASTSLLMRSHARNNLQWPDGQGKNLNANIRKTVLYQATKSRTKLMLSCDWRCRAHAAVADSCLSHRMFE